MPCGLIIITKSYDGEEWSNGYGFTVGADTTPPTVPSDLSIIGTENIINDATTDPTNIAFEGAQYLLPALIAFERLMHLPFIEFVRCDVNDGVKGSSVFASIPLGFSGLRSGEGVTNQDIMPANVALLVQKKPGVGSVRSGRSFYRSILSDGNVALGGKRGIKFSGETVRGILQGWFDGWLVESELKEYLTDGAMYGEQTLAIPSYHSADSPTPGDLLRVYPISSLIVQRPVSRQVARGRRKKT